MNLFSGGDIVEKISNAADKIVFTDQEKSELFIEYQKATMPQNLTRRFLTLLIVGVFIALIVSSILMYKIDRDYSQFIYDMAKEVLSTPTSIIIGFYFLKRFGMGK